MSEIVQLITVKLFLATNSLQNYDCHINVELCQSLKAIKDIFKYVYNDYDKASM